MKYYNHAVDIGFEVITKEEDTNKITEQELIKALERRLTDLKYSQALNEGSIIEVFGFFDEPYAMTSEEVATRLRLTGI